MPKYKCFLAAFLSCCLLTLLMGGCDRPPASSEMSSTPSRDPVPSTEATQASAQAVMEIPEIPRQNVRQDGSPKSLEEWLFTNYQQSFSWQDQLGNLCYATITLPALTPVDDFAIAFNEEIHECGEQMLSDVRKSMAEGYGSGILSMSYQAWLNDEILSLLVTTHFSDGTLHYLAYNFDLEDREALSAAEMCDEVLDMEYPIFLMATDRIVYNRFEKQYLPALPDRDDPLLKDDDLAILQLYDETLAKIGHDTTVMGGRSLLMCEDGQILLAYYAPTMDGNGYYTAYSETIIPWAPEDISWEKPPTEAQAYHELFYLTYEVDGAYAEAYAGILQDAFLADEEDFMTFAGAESETTQESILFLLTHITTDLEHQEMTDACQALIDDGDASEDVRNMAQRLHALLSA